MAAWTDRAGSTPSSFISALHLSQLRKRLSRSGGSDETFASSDAITAGPVFPNQWCLGAVLDIEIVFFSTYGCGEFGTFWLWIRGFLVMDADESGLCGGANYSPCWPSSLPLDRLMK
jgi:hypothetical protein